VTAPLRQTQPPGFSLPLDEISVCLGSGDTHPPIAFNGREDRACVKCGAEVGLVRVRVTAIDAETLKKETAPRGGASTPESLEETERGTEVPAR
jgi:hypothetical protein